MFITAIILGHLAGFIALAWLVLLLFRRRFSSDRKRRWVTLAVGCAVGALYVAAAIANAYIVRPTTYELTTEKALGQERLRVALVSDCHLGVALDGDGLARLLERIDEYQPDMLAITGDLVDKDTSREDMLTACEALGEFTAPLGVYFVSGNHDGGNGYFTAAELFSALEENGVTVLEDEAAFAGEVCIVGRRDAYQHDRADVEDIIPCVPGRYTIVLDHQPSDYAAEAAAGADLVLSGHTHGGQLLPLPLMLSTMGFCDKVYGRTVMDGTQFVVTSGAGCLAVPMRTGTPTEFVIIDITEA